MLGASAFLSLSNYPGGVAGLPQAVPAVTLAAAGICALAFSFRRRVGKPLFLVGGALFLGVFAYAVAYRWAFAGIE